MFKTELIDRVFVAFVLINSTPKSCNHNSAKKMLVNDRFGEIPCSMIGWRQGKKKLQWKSFFDTVNVFSTAFLHRTARQIVKCIRSKSKSYYVLQSNLLLSTTLHDLLGKLSEYNIAISMGNLSPEIPGWNQQGKTPQAWDTTPVFGQSVD